MAEKNGIADQFELIKNYARQETLDPLKGAGRWVGMGLAGSFLLMIGGVTLTLALLRFIQEGFLHLYSGIYLKKKWSRWVGLKRMANQLH